MKMLMTKQLKFEGGNISLKNITMTLMPSFLTAEITKYFMKENNMPKLYLLSWYWGFVLVKQVDQKFNLKKSDEIYSLGMELGEAMGIGIYKTHDYYPGRYTHFVIPNNPFMKYFTPEDKSKGPIDYFISGCMAGGGCHVHSALCQNVEIKCQATGNQECEFLTATEKELKDRGLWDIAVQRYDLNNIMPIQKEIYEEYSESNEAKLLSKIVDEL